MTWAAIVTQIGKIAARHREVAAALVAAPVEEELSTIFTPRMSCTPLLAIGQNEHVVGAHGGADATPDRLLPEDGRIGAELAGALERDRFGVEGAHEHHPAIKRNQRRRVTGEWRQRLRRFALRIEKLRITDLEACDDRHRSPPTNTSPTCQS